MVDLYQVGTIWFKSVKKIQLPHLSTCLPLPKELKLTGNIDTDHQVPIITIEIHSMYKPQDTLPMYNYYTLQPQSMTTKHYQSHTFLKDHSQHMHQIDR